MNDRNYKYLDKIDLPKDLRKFDKNDLENICNDLREFIINSISENGGHFGASLGVVELTVALHYVYNTPEDSIVWDVGHQAYGHKILTGRKKEFHTNRIYKGISGFPKISESEYDTFGVGHVLSLGINNLQMNSLNYQNPQFILGQKPKNHYFLY